MRKQERRTLDAAERVLAFSREHPGEQPAVTSAVEVLTGLAAQATALLAQREGGERDWSSTVVGKARVRRGLRVQLEHLVGIADAASLRQPDQAVALRLPSLTAGRAQFAARVRDLVAAARGRQELLATYGLPDGLLGEIEQALARYEGVEGDKWVARQRAVGATAELRQVTRSIAIVLRHLDALNRIRFADDAEVLAAWRSARELYGPMKGGAAPPAADRPAA